MDDATAAPPRARVGGLELAIAALAATLVALAALVAAGRLDGLDRYAVGHWMPGFDPANADDTIPSLTGAFLPFQPGTEGWHLVASIVLYPASVLVSLAIFAAGAAVLWRRGARTAAVVWACTWFVANALEVLLKIGIEKPALYAERGGVSYHLASFDHSFPSGHMMRAVLVAGVVAYVWGRLGAVAAAWTLALPVVLVAASWHVPSDVAGGVLFGALVVLAAWAAAARGAHPKGR